MLPGNNSVAILLAAKKPFRVDSIVGINSLVAHCTGVKQNAQKNNV